MGRRVFLKAGACALFGGSGVPRFLVRAASAAPARRTVLVAVFQRGAVDGLGMIAPHGDPAYAAQRPSIALQAPQRGDADRAVDLDGFFALHPGLAPLGPLWQARTLAVVHACGSPDATRSHFDAQDYMESGTPGVKSTPDGWLSRAIVALPDRPSPFRAVAVTGALPRSLRGEAGALAMQSIARFGVPAARTSKPSIDWMARAPASPRRQRGSMPVSATARKGDRCSGSMTTARASHPSGVLFTPGVPLSM